MRIHHLMLATVLAAFPAAAVDVNVIGLFPGKAVIVVNRGAPRTVSVGQRTAEGVLLVSVDSDSALVEVEGKRERLALGQHFESEASTGARQKVTLSADERGHYVVDGRVNGTHIRFLLDTGATSVSLSAAEARRLGIDYRRGERALSVMADGRQIPSYRIKLDSVAVGDITLFGVEGIVHEGMGAGVALLGMSFLNRTEIRRDGTLLTLIKRY